MQSEWVGVLITFLTRTTNTNDVEDVNLEKQQDLPLAIRADDSVDVL